MADTYTTNLGLTKPELGGSVDSWGQKLNNNVIDTIDAIFSATGTAVNVRFASANFDDNAKAIFGSGDDFEIYHSGSASIVREASSGNLVLAGNDVNITNGAMNETHIDCNNNGSVDLYFDNAKKFETTSSGVSISGNIAVTGTVDGVDISSLSTVATSGSYNDLSNKPTIPTNNNQLTNGAGYVTSDTNTTYSAGTGMSLSGTTFNCTIDSPSEVGLGNLSSSGNNLSGSFTATGNITAYSDARLKENVATIENALDKVCNMRGVTFTKDGELSSGVIAQELEKIAPELVIEGEYKSVAYGNIVGYLIESIKELKDELKELRGV